MRNLIARFRPDPCEQRPRTQAPSAGVPFTAPPPSYPVPPQAAMVRPYITHLERKRHQQRIDRSRLGLAVLLDLARPVGVAA
ncbi:hypothetical protein DEF23_16855 [Marinitenerispora sediminis]|uniref:Uncharacterized protein n=1 Tax=Marinitenerispora sediminis TaxID=1931232 RepID=A0A368T4J7_9ACTN|nr:hypothetical protein DEF28_19660 [Marinitenerispora sediminis]RCV53925.1 hypothetical protein DEF23_16855 [Marinitenerispora sediminis]RCV58397.1 hypothetical protein DEF24_13595 [Marinitenerispora sediminis]